MELGHRGRSMGHAWCRVERVPGRGSDNVITRFLLTEVLTVQGMNWITLSAMATPALVSIVITRFLLVELLTV